MCGIRSRFDQQGFKVLSNLEQLLLKACGGQNFENELQAVCEFFYEDFSKDDLASELTTRHKLYKCALLSEVYTYLL